VEVTMKENDITDLDKTESIIEDKNEVYQREDSEKGFVRNSIEIPLLKASRKYDVIANMLLGNFDDDGKYIIPKEILQELIALKKYIYQKTPEGTIIKGEYKDGYGFEFFLTKPKIDKEKEKGMCVLYIREIVSKVNGYIQNTLSTPVGTYIYKYDELYDSNSLKAFNINEQKEGDDGAMKKPTYFIDARFEYLKAVTTASQELYKLLELNYFNKRIQILNEIPQGTIILSEFNKKRDQLDKYFLAENKNKYRFLNELLTSILEANPNILAQMPAYKILMGSLNNKYLYSIIEIGEKIKKDSKVTEAKQKQIDLLEGKTSVAIKEILGNVGKIAVGAPTKKKSGPAKSKGNSGGGGGGGKGGGGKDGDGGGGKKDKKKEDEKKKVLGSGVKNKPVNKTEPTKTEATKKESAKKEESAPEKSPSKKGIPDFKSWNSKNQEGFNK